MHESDVAFNDKTSIIFWGVEYPNIRQMAFAFSDGWRHCNVAGMGKFRLLSQGFRVHVYLSMRRDNASHRRAGNIDVENRHQSMPELVQRPSDDESTRKRPFQGLA
jgi:hypothetical protein